jgi:hypothetical protein
MDKERKSIAECGAFAKLRELAKTPIDLTAANVLSPERVQKYCCHGDPFDLLYSCQRVTDEVLDALQDL